MELVNRIKGLTPLEFWRDVAHIQLPEEQPTEQEISNAYVAITEVPTAHGTIADLYDAIQVIRRIPNKEREHEVLLERYGLLIEQLFKLSLELNNRMDRDVSATEELEREEGEKGE